MKPINREILRLAVPNILSNISVPLLSTVDTALMGHLSDVHIGAVGVGSMIFNFIYWNFGFLRMGTTGLTAQAFGRNDGQAMVAVLGRSSLVALALAAVILFLQYPLSQLGLQFMRAEDDLALLILKYFQIRIWAAPATLLLYAITGWFFGLQNAIYPLILTVIVNIVNIVLSYILVFQWGWDIEGVAWGTVVAQYFGLIIAFLLLSFKYRPLLIHLQLKLVLKWEAFRVFLRINRDIFIRTFFLTFAFGFFYSRSTTMGPEILAVNVILLQFVNWMSYGIDGFAFASESLVGKYYGAKNLERTKAAISTSFKWSFAMAVITGIMYMVFGRQLLAVFTDQPLVLEAAVPYLKWVAIFPIVAFSCYIWDGVYIGLTASVAMRNSMALALVVYLLVYFLLDPILGNDGLWLSLLIFLAARGIFQWGLYRRRGFDLK